MQRRIRTCVAAGLLGAVFAGVPARSWSEDLTNRIDQLEQELQRLKQELQAQKAAQRAAEERVAAQHAAEEQARQAAAPPRAMAAAHAPDTQSGVNLLDNRVRVGGYGSTRFEASDHSDLNTSFVFRRLVLTGDAVIAPRLRSAFELEFERFRKLEIEKTTEPEAGGLKAEQAVEGTNKSEIALEQAWLQYDLEDWLKFRGGGILVPLGRFNLRHDDNLWNLPRRSLVDRGVPVLPSTSAWSEVGLGFLGDVALTDEAMLDYQVYVMNGVSLDSEIELIGQTRDPRRDKFVYEVELSPSTGGFAADVNDSKAVGGRVALSPALGHEVAGSWYYGQYTPDYLSNEDLWSFGLDGASGWGPFEVEAQGIFTRFDGTRNVATSLARTAWDQAAESADPNVETEVEFELANLAKNKYGYWTEFRYRFFPAAWRDTLIARSFANPQFIGTIRAEQAWLDGLVTEVGFARGELTAFETSNRRVDRFTIGFAYRPVPLVVFQLAYEYTQTNTGQSLASVTNYLPTNSDAVNYFLFGSAFGF